MKNSGGRVSSVKEYSFLSGGGEMGAHIRAKDWCNTPLGDPGTWPQSLRTMVSVMLDNPFGMYIAWGPDYIQLYNDGYRPILGSTKHPHALGISTRETFEEIWHIVGPMFDKVMKGQAVRAPDFMYRLNRNGFMEDCYFDFSYSPIRKEDGEAGGVLVTVIETTNKKLAEAELKESRQQLQFAIEAAELATWDYDPLTNKFTSNDRLKEWFGLKRERETDLQEAINSIAEKDQELVSREIKKSLQYTAGGKYDIEFTIVHPITFGERIVRARGKAWFGEDNIGYRLNGTIQDVTEQVIARKNLEKSEEQLRIALEGGELGTFDFFPRESKLLWSAKTKELFGLPAEAEVNIDVYLQGLHPGDKNTSGAIAQQRANQAPDGLYEMEYRTIGITDGKIRWLRSKGIATYDSEGQAIRYTGVIQEITKQKESEAALQEKQAETEKLRRLYETITSNTPDLIYIFDLNYRFTYANPALLSMWGKTWEEAIGKNLLENGYEPWHATRHEREIDEIVAGRKSIRSTVSFPHAELGKRVYDYILVPVLNDEGNVEAIAGTTRDITEITKTEEELTRFKHMADNAIDPFILIREDGSLAYLNNMALKHWGYTREEAADLHLADIDMLYNDEVFKTFFAPALQEQIPQFETLHRKKDGTILPVEKNMGGLILEGKPYLFAIARDITERKKNEREMKESEERFRTLAETLPQLVWVTDANGQQEYASRRWKEYSGIDPVDVETWQQILHPEDIEKINNSWAKSLTSGGRYREEVRLKNNQGNYLWHFVQGEAIRNENGEIVKWIGAFTNIHEQKLKEEQKDEFISIASHEMKTPLTTAKAYLQLLELTISAENTNALLQAKKASYSVDRLNDLINELLDVSKIQNGKLNYHITSFDFNEVISETIEDARKSAPGYTIMQESNIRQNVKGDKFRIQQVVINLLSNAIKYSPDNKNISVNVSEVNNIIEVAIKDNGIGISKENVKNIFEKYYRVTHESAHFDGLGIGLFISFEIIQRHHGKMWVESEPGKGSTFCFTIPTDLE
ncbi:MAG: PAS domain S-box protein [Ginsengibacter sp.]